MPSMLLELGELEHIHDSLNLKLRTNVTLSLSQLSPFSISGSADLETLISTGTWIAGGNRLQIYVRFILDDIEILDCGNASIVEEIGVRLCNAEIWSQLGLDATHNVPENATEGSDRAANELVLTLSGQTIGHTTVNAPGSVRSACLESISLLFSFSTCRRIRISSDIREQSMAPVGEAEHTASLHSQDPDACDISQGPARPEQQWPRLDAESHYQDQDQAIGSPSERQIFSRSASHPSSIVMPVSNSQGSVSSMHSRSSGRFSAYLSHSSSLGCKHATQQIRFEHLLRMLNASLRLAICDREASKREGVILAKDTGFPRLVGISPALFSPGFLEAVSRRNSLLPNIAHPMCGVYRRTRSSNLNRKIERLLETFPDGNLAHGSPRSDDPQSNKASLPAAIQARLWYLMQHNLLNIQAWPKRKTEILSGPQTTCERELGSYMLDDLLPDQNTETGWKDEVVDLLLEGQYAWGEVKSGVGHHPFDEPDGTGAQYSNNDPSTRRHFPIDDDRLGEDLLWTEWKTASDERSAEGDLSYGQTETLEAADDMDEDLFRSETDLQGPYQDTRTDMLDEISSAEQDYYNQASCEGHPQCKPTKPWDNHREEILDNEQDKLKDHQIHPDDECGSCQVDLEDMLNEPSNVLDNCLAHFSARAEDHQELLDARQDNRNTNQDFPEGFSLDAPGQMDHEEVLDDVEVTLQSNQVLSEWFPPYKPWEQGHQERLDEREIILDPQTATVPDAGFTKEFFGYDGDEMLDGERMIFDAGQGNQALIMV